MKTPLAVVVSLAILVLVSGCGLWGQSRNVLRGCDAVAAYVSDSTEVVRLGCGAALGPLADSADAADSTVVRIYLDRYGDVYPGPGVGTGIPDAAFRGPPESLMESFAYWAAPTAGQKGMPRPVPGPHWDRVVSDLGLTLPAGPTRLTGTVGSTARRQAVPPEIRQEWRRVQDSLRAGLAEWVAQAMARAGAERLVVLIHGYNVGEPEVAFARIREKLAETVPDGVGGAVYLLVSWDGLEAGNVAGPVTVWTKAQYNFPLVGMGLRKLFNEAAFPRDIDVRVLTHSSGGPVAAHAFWDASAVLGRRDGYASYLAEAAAGEESPVPRFRDVRLGMIVPATSQAIFTRYDPAETPHISRISLGFNPRDFAVAKGPASCEANGVTCLATRPDRGCAVLSRFAQVPGTDVYGFDFSGYRGDGYAGEGWKTRLFCRTYEIHNTETYLVRLDFEPFAQSVFTDARVQDEWKDYCDGVRLPDDDDGVPAEYEIPQR